MKCWFVYRSVSHRAMLHLRARTAGRWLGPPILATSMDSVMALLPRGATLLRLP